ncbi:hypothetical protein CPC08DRAFT_725038 [Agrocybe pediades]|nr:hypothetical protein CPC08DRAFT_725038 [Agrocybe pediades]
MLVDMHFLVSFESSENMSTQFLRAIDAVSKIAGCTPSSFRGLQISEHHLILLSEVTSTWQLCRMVESAEEVTSPESVQFLCAFDAVSEIIGLKPVVFRTLYDDVNTSDDSLASQAADIVLQSHGDLLNADDEEYELANLLNCMVKGLDNVYPAPAVGIEVDEADALIQLLPRRRAFMSHQLEEYVFTVGGL